MKDKVRSTGLKKCNHDGGYRCPDDERPPPSPLSRLACQDETGLVVVYPDRSYADQKGRTFLNQLHQYLPNAEYYEALPARIMECCRGMRNRVTLEYPAQLEMTGAFDLGEENIRFRVLSVPLKRQCDRTTVLILLDKAKTSDLPWLTDRYPGTGFLDGSAR